jgi:uncharacterized membrane protein YphA (DoxX/SURF4 family)
MNGQQRWYSPTIRAFLNSSFVCFLLRVLVGFVLIYSSIGKVERPHDFLASVIRYEILPPKLAIATALCLPALEFVLGTCLVGGLFLEGSLGISAAMFAAFVVAQVWAVSQGLRISCGCFANGGDMIGGDTILRAGVLFLIVCFLLFQMEAPTRKFVSRRPPFMS